MIQFTYIHPGDRVTDAQVRRVYQGIAKRTLPKPEWTHGAHLCAGAAIMLDMGLVKAERALPDIIRNYNTACGVPNSDSEGYHHTLTLFYLRKTATFLGKATADTLGNKATALLASDIADRAYPLRFYRRDTLFSVEARRNWVSGDLS